jgi:hypothetical protein
VWRGWTSHLLYVSIVDSMCLLVFCIVLHGIKLVQSVILDSSHCIEFMCEYARLMQQRRNSGGGGDGYLLELSVFGN